MRAWLFKPLYSPLELLIAVALGGFLPGVVSASLRHFGL
jgi:hypothetical protein